MSVHVKFTATGGVIAQTSPGQTPIRLAVSAIAAADPVELTEDEAVDLGCWLRQALPRDDWHAVSRRFNQTPWKRARDRAEELDAMAEADEARS